MEALSRSISDPAPRARDELTGLSIDWQTVDHIVELAGLEGPCREALREGIELIDECAEGVDRIHSIVREVGGFSSENSREDFLETSFDEIVARSLRIAQLNAPYGLMIERNLDPEVRIDCHSEEIERVVTNLLVNSMQALEGNRPGTGHLAIAVATFGDQAVLHVEDDGGGIDAEVLDRIFDPFFTTKPAGNGAGAGDFVSHREGTWRRHPRLLRPRSGYQRERRTPPRGALPVAAERGRLKSGSAMAESSNGPIGYRRRPMPAIQLSGFMVQPIARRIRDWNQSGKISEEDLDRSLSTDARALVDHSLALADWAPIDDVEALVGLAAEQIGVETGLVEWAEEIVGDWQAEESIEDLIRAGRALVDSPGFVLSQVSRLVLRDADWSYEGGRSSFSVRLHGMADVSPALKALIGALFARLAVVPCDRDFDVRFDGIDDGDLIIFGESLAGDGAVEAESRLHQAALIA